MAFDTFIFLIFSIALLQYDDDDAALLQNNRIH